MPSDRDSYYVRSLDKGLTVLQTFGAGAGQLTTSEVAEQSGLSRAAARRFLLTLNDLGFLASDGKHFWLTPRSLNLGYAYLSNLSLPQIADPHLEWLARELNESTSICILDGHDVVYVARVPATRPVTVMINVGTRFPAYATSMGRVLLAGLDDQSLEKYLSEVEVVPFTDRSVSSTDELRERIGIIRDRGWSLSRQELMEGLRGIAAPIRHRGEVIAAANVSLDASRATIEEIEADVVPQLLELVDRIERDIAGRDANFTRSLLQHLRPTQFRT